jgi:hypothetical protein
MDYDNPHTVGMTKRALSLNHMNIIPLTRMHAHSSNIQLSGFAKPEPTWLFIHVDDIVTGGPESHTITETLSNRYRCHEVEPLHYILGMKIEYDQTNRTITFHPANSVLKALEKHGMQDCAHKQVPMPPSFKPTESVFEPDEHVDKLFKYCWLSDLHCTNHSPRYFFRDKLSVAFYFCCYTGTCRICEKYLSILSLVGVYASM